MPCMATVPGSFRNHCAVCSRVGCSRTLTCIWVTFVVLGLLGHPAVLVSAPTDRLPSGTLLSPSTQRLRATAAAPRIKCTMRSAVPSAKEELVRLCEDFRTKQEEMWDVMDKEASVEKATQKGAGKKAAPSLLEAESFASQKIELSSELEGLREKVVNAISIVAANNPNPEPLRGWRGFGGAAPAECILNGTWKLLFTDAADATFKRGKRGAASTFQEIDAAGGWFINCVDFSNPDSKLKGFRVFVEGDALNGNEVQLSFRKVRLLRRSRFPRFFGEITIPLPSPKILRNIGRLFARAKDKEQGVNPSRRGAGFTLLYVDEDLRIHQTFDGLYFVQRRLR
eukprot:TRINITY_DN21576_c0_g1_i1.p1 TRINITY_DN21576_c0_g1~~TRINITY_DN21576_c0_g1_i1.p1  ORF type:complete len:349 (-),score=57.13 TRINITY_DN21576_c0_g1_i1:132-1151(-)